MWTKGEPKPVATGKKGNVGGKMTPGRHGRMIKGLTALVKAGPATKKTAAVSNMPRPEGMTAKIDAGNVKAGSLGMTGVVSGSPKMVKGGSVNTMSKIRPEGSIKRDSASVVKP